MIHNVFLCEQHQQTSDQKIILTPAECEKRLSTYLMKVVRMDHTGHFGFRSKIVLIWKILRFFWEKSFFEIMVKLIYFVEVSFLKSSPMSVRSRRGFYFWKISISGFLGHVHLEKCAFPYIWWLFQTWLVRPNHHAHEIRIEILCRTPLSILKYLSTRPQNHSENSKCSSLARMFSWSFMICPFHMFFSHYFHIIFT